MNLRIWNSSKSMLKLFFEIINSLGYNLSSSFPIKLENCQVFVWPKVFLTTKYTYIEEYQSIIWVSSAHFSCSVVSDSLQPQGLQHARLSCPSPTPGACSNSCLLSRWCHQPISSSVIPYSSCLHSFPASGSFPMSQFFASRAQSIGSFSFNIGPSNEYSGLISLSMDWLDFLAVQGTLKSLLQHHTSKASILWHSAFFTVQFSHLYMTTGKTIALTRWTFVGKVMSLIFNMLSRLIKLFF